MNKLFNNFWEDEEQVQRFAARDADHRLSEIVKTYPEPAKIKVLDLGCAAGRNSVLLAQYGFQLQAIDFSKAMVQKTRQRVAEIIGLEQAQKIIRVASMEDLSDFPSHFFDFIIALGIYHNASSQKQWDQTLSESARVLKSGGKLLVSNFGPDSQPEGKALIPLKNESHVYDGFGPGPLYLIDADALDTELARFGFHPITPTQTVKTATEKGYRQTINGWYQKI